MTTSHALNNAAIAQAIENANDYRIKGRPVVEAEDLTFGVEIETHVPYSRPEQVGFEIQNYSARTGSTPNSVLPEFNGSRWAAKSDCSIVTPNGNRRGAEFVSPVLKGEEGMRNLKDALDVIKGRIDRANDTASIVGSDGVARRPLGARVNSSCGVHIHIGFPSTDLRTVQRLVHLIAGFEEGLYAVTGTTRRENNHYCPKVKRAFRPAHFQDEQALRHGRPAYERYCGLNLSNLLNGTRPAIEFRLFAGSTNPEKILSYVQLCLGLVQLALSTKRNVDWTPKPAGATYGAKRGQGYREAERLMRRLGWLNATAQRLGTVGRIHGQGLPTLNRSIKVLRELATKYDSRSE